MRWAEFFAALVTLVNTGVLWWSSRKAKAAEGKATLLDEWASIAPVAHQLVLTVEKALPEGSGVQKDFAYWAHALDAFGPEAVARQQANLQTIAAQLSAVLPHKPKAP